MADFWEDDQRAATQMSGRAEVNTDGLARERRSFEGRQDGLDEGEVIARLRSVRDQLADAGPVAYSALIRLIDRYTGDSQADTDDVVGAATAVLERTRFVSGGAIEDLRATMGVDSGT
jgi:hypothetical protein